MRTFRVLTRGVSHVFHTQVSPASLVALRCTPMLRGTHATSSCDRLGVDHMFDEPGQRNALGFTRHSDGFVFHRRAGDEDS